MKPIWDRIYVWLAANAPVVIDGLRPGASDEQIRQTERALGVTFPEDVRAAYRMHDGQSEDTSSFEGFGWAPLERAMALWHHLKEGLDAGAIQPGPPRVPLDEVHDLYWNAAWVPLTEDGNGNHHFLDLTPAGRGRILRYSEWCQTRWSVAAPSFRDWLAGFAAELECGIYVVEPYGLYRP
jgi:cell wall assembly regulator SMI1